MDLSDRIRTARRAAGLRQSDLADLACVSLQHIAFLEQGRRVGSPTVIRILSDVLGVDLRECHEAAAVAQLQRRLRWIRVQQ